MTNENKASFEREIKLELQVSELRRQLDAMTAERDAFKDQCRCVYCGSHHFNISVCSKCTFTKPAAEPFKINHLGQQHSTLQATIAERVTEVGELNVKLRDAVQEAGRLRAMLDELIGREQDRETRRKAQRALRGE